MPEQNFRIVNSVAAAGARQPRQANISGRMSARPISEQSDQPSCMPVTGQPVPGMATIATPASPSVSICGRKRKGIIFI